MKSPLGIPVFRRFWIATLVSHFGGLIQGVGAAWTMATLSDSPQLIALVQASATLPLMLLSLFAGAAADNLDRRRVMLAAQGAMLAVSAGLTLAAWMGALTPPLLLAFTFLIGCGTALNAPAWQASVGDLVPRDALPRAVALNSMGFNIARSAGPAIGGAIVTLAGGAAAFLVNTLSYFGLLAALATWRPVRPGSELPRERLGAAMVAGIRYAAMSPSLRVVLLRAACFGLGASAILSLMPLIARDLLGGGALTYGLLLGGFGAGAVIAALASGRLRARWSANGIAGGATLAMALAALVASGGTGLPLTLAGLTVAGAGWLLGMSTFNISVQMSSPRWVVGRALALYQMAAFGGVAGGSWLFGGVAERHGAATALLAGAVALGGAFLLGLRAPLAQNEGADLDPDGRWRPPGTAFAVDWRSGPVAVTIEHRVAEENAAPFLHAMNERKRIRRRDGARRWTLSHDLGDGELWIERYQFATWLDYLRHNARRTRADAANADGIRSLRRSGAEPVIRRMIERPVAGSANEHAPFDPGARIDV